MIITSIRMNENHVRNLNFTRLCRCCILEHDFMYDIFCGTCSNAQTYYEVIMECAPVQIFRDDGLPSLVCHKCVSILESFVVFRKKCVESELNLKEMIGNSSPDKQKTLGSNRTFQNDPTLYKEESNDIDYTTKPETESDDPEENSMNEIYPEVILCNEIKIENTTVNENTSDTNSPTDRVYPEVDQRSIENFFNVKEEFVDDYRDESDKPYLDIDRTKERARPRDNVHSCDRCEKSFKFRSFLDRHRRVHTDVKPYACDECSKTFTSKQNLDAHRNTHTGVTPYVCDECSKSFNRKSYLYKHRKIHTDEKPYPCDECAKSFVSKTILDTHQKTHAVEKPYSCDTCERSFSRKDYLNKHQQIHTDERPFSCDVCAKSFRGKWDLNLHRKIHTGDKPYPCDECEKSFALKSLLNRHRKTHAGKRAGTNRSHR